jgi:hypothetical protein
MEVFAVIAVIAISTISTISTIYARETTTARGPYSNID